MNLLFFYLATQSIQFHGSTIQRDLDVHCARLRGNQRHSLSGQPFLALRVAFGARHGPNETPQRFHHIQHALVLFGRVHAAGRWHSAPLGIGSFGDERLVVLHSHPNQLVHSQSGRFSHCRTNGCADRVGRRSGQADRNPVRCIGRRCNQRIFQSIYFLLLLFTYLVPSSILKLFPIT